MSDVYRLRNWRTGLYFVVDQGFTHEVGHIWTTAETAQAAFDSAALLAHREDKVPLYDFYLDHEMVVTQMLDVGTVQATRLERDDGR